MKSRLLALLLLAGCGYRPDSSCIAERYQTVCIPYTEGELSAPLTAALARQLAQSPYRYVSSGGALLLNVEVVEINRRPRGYRYDANVENKPTKLVVTAEEEVELVAEVSLTESATGCPVLPCTRVRAALDYDFQPKETRTSQLALSLGELDSPNGARVVACTSATDLLARRIVDLLTAAW
jgi:hypothetical protein